MSDPFKTQEGGDHYQKLAIQPMQYALKNGLDYGQSNVVKYVTRFKDKNGKEDLLKAKHCIDLLIAHYYPDVEDPHVWVQLPEGIGDVSYHFSCSHCGARKEEPYECLSK